MSVSRTAVRLIAACVASGAFVAAAAVPALADGVAHGRDTRGSHSADYRSDAVRGDHGHAGGLDRDGGWYRDRDRGRFGDGDRGRHHGWYRMWHRRHHHHHFLGRG